MASRTGRAAGKPWLPNLMLKRGSDLDARPAGRFPMRQNCLGRSACCQQEVRPRARGGTVWDNPIRHIEADAAAWEELLDRLEGAGDDNKNG